VKGSWHQSCPFSKRRPHRLTLVQEKEWLQSSAKSCNYWIARSPRTFLTISFRQNSTEAQREDHEDDIIAIVRAALVDDEANVRSAAAQAFDVLQEEMGAKAIDQTIPTLLEALRQPGKGSGTALQALKEVMNVSFAVVSSSPISEVSLS
jgi:hypothetical protein